MSFTREIGATGRRAADDVWDRYVRPRRWPEWSPQIRAVDYPLERLEAGTIGTVHGPAGLPVRFHIVEVDEDARAWTWTVKVAGVRLTLRHTVEALRNGETRTRLRVEGLAPVVIAYLPVARWALGRLVSAR